MKAKKYPNLHKLSWTSNWVFRKYSSEKRRGFTASTGLEAIESNAPAAYKIGVELFNDWLGVYIESGRPLLIRDIARAVLASKESSKGGMKGANYRSAYNQIINHIIPAFGHFRPDQITPTRWDQYDAEERKKKKVTKHGKVIRRTRMANTRKLLMDILHRAQEHGQLKKLPKLKNHDPKAAPPRHIPDATMRKLLRNKHLRFSKYFYFLLWKQGPRPEEALQYQWPMFKWDEGEHGVLAIPGEITKTGRPRTIPLNSRVSRVFKKLYGRSENDWVFPSRYLPGERQRNYRKGWEGACQDLGVNFDPYNVRDTFITNALKRGLSSTFIGKYCDNSAAVIDARYAVAEREVMASVAG